MQKITYNTPIMVTETQYNTIMRKYAGSCAGRETNGLYYIMLWVPCYKQEIEKLLN
jgi:hypothetical protein